MQLIEIQCFILFKIFYIIVCFVKLPDCECFNIFLIVVLLRIYSLLHIQKYNFNGTNLSRVSNILPILRYKMPFFNLLKVFLIAKEGFIRIRMSRMRKMLRICQRDFIASLASFSILLILIQMEKF